MKVKKKNPNKEDFQEISKSKLNLNKFPDDEGEISREEKIQQTVLDMLRIYIPIYFY